MKNKFIQAIHDKNKLKVVFFSKEDNSLLTRICAPMDYGIGTRIKDSIPRFYLWDYTSDTKSHTLPLKMEQIKSIEVLDEIFDPAGFVKWSPNWIIPRDWGKYS